MKRKPVGLLMVPLILLLAHLGQQGYPVALVLAVAVSGLIITIGLAVILES